VCPALQCGFRFFCNTGYQLLIISNDKIISHWRNVFSCLLLGNKNHKTHFYQVFLTGDVISPVQQNSTKMPDCSIVREGNCLNLDFNDLHDDHDLECFPFGSSLQDQNQLYRTYLNH